MCDVWKERIRFPLEVKAEHAYESINKRFKSSKIDFLLIPDGSQDFSPSPSRVPASPAAAKASTCNATSRTRGQIPRTRREAHRKQDLDRTRAGVPKQSAKGGEGTSSWGVLLLSQTNDKGTQAAPAGI